MPVGSSCEFHAVLSAAVAPSEVASVWYPVAGHPIVVNTTVGSSCRVAPRRNGTKSQVLVAWSKLPRWLWFLGGVDLVIFGTWSAGHGCMLKVFGNKSTLVPIGGGRSARVRTPCSAQRCLSGRRCMSGWAGEKLLWDVKVSGYVAPT